MWRHRLFGVAFGLNAVFWATLILLMSPLPFRWRHKVGSYWADGVIWLAKIICGIDWQVIGREHIPDQPCILLLNHQSNWETFFTTLLKRDLVWLLKKEITDMPYVGWAIRLMNPIAIDRTQGRVAMKMLMCEGAKRIASGYSLVIYPEGTRSAVDAPQPFKMGAGRLAHELGVPVIPIAHNAGQFWPVRGQTHSGVVQVVVGEAIDPHGLSPKDINAQAEAWISVQRDALVAAEKARREASDALAY
ncbi:1-acyl-sn-glycerol-3-phosphate acyltransferase [Suttonella sp. R2A3]|uniref:lysophospholipid acyltransferase family protein n=1 Tax=Suttonella sp. R2A3 TaxID=2908648 RepID=UPI001F1DCAF3|nr:lysophospholipid acyltransferase family protein [Suttonella sp. R2A3]UJF23821.1 1-acyl-sn-glycerol-3-phosphate acyltransferase [Suttonella sp. R2A3]